MSDPNQTELFSEDEFANEEKEKLDLAYLIEVVELVYSPEYPTSTIIHLLEKKIAEGVDLSVLIVLQQYVSQTLPTKVNSAKALIEIFSSEEDRIVNLKKKVDGLTDKLRVLSFVLQERLEMYGEKE